MVSYHIFFNPRAGIPDDQAVAAARKFFEYLKAEGRLGGYRILRVTNSASFPALPRFQAIADYHSEADLDASFSFLQSGEKIKTGPHGDLIRLIAEFKVSFTADV